MNKNPKIILEPFGKHCTIKKSIIISGQTPYIANHQTKMILHPATCGIRFKYSHNKIKHIVNVNCKNTKSANGENTTLIASKSSTVKTVEHILSALSGLGITACDIELMGSNQVPIPDTSSETFTKKLIKNGIIKTSANKTVAKIINDIYFSDNNGSSVIARPSKKLNISVLIQFPKPIGEQYLKYTINPKTYLNKICWARSYIRRDCDTKVWKLCRKQIPGLPKDINKSPV